MPYQESETADFYDETIIVPFSPESMLSGVGKIVMPHQRLHYRKKFTLPEGFKKSRVLLHFGAVDQECSVFVNGIRVGGQRGYLPFHFDITDSLRQGGECAYSFRDRWTEQSLMPEASRNCRKKENTPLFSTHLRAGYGKPSGWKAWKRPI